MKQQKYYYYHYEIKRTVVEYYTVQAMSKKEAMELVSLKGGPSKIIVKSETVKKVL